MPKDSEFVVKKQLMARKILMSPWALLLIFAIIAFGIFGQSIGHHLLFWDDSNHLCQNPALFPRANSDLTKLWSQPFFDLYIPVTYTLWWVLIQIGTLFGVAAECANYTGLFHAFNLVLQVSDALLLFYFLRNLLQITSSNDEILIRRSALMGSLLFLLHPLQVESVAWVSGMRDLLALMFLLMTGLIYLRRPLTGQYWGHLFLATPFFVLALLSKPTATIAPALFFAIECLALQIPWRKALLHQSPWALLGLALSAVTMHLQGSSIVTHTDLWDRWQFLFFSSGFYISKLLLPYPLAVDYGLPAAQLAKKAWLLPLSVLILVILAITAWVWRRSLLQRTAFAIFLLALLPTSGIVDFAFERTSLVADRFAFLAMLGASLAFAGAYFRFPRLRPYFVVPLVACAILSFVQTSYWQDDLTLFAHSIEVIPKASTAQGNYGLALYIRGQFADAEAPFRASLAADPENQEAAISLGRDLEKQNKPAEAISFYKEELLSGHNWPPLHNNLANLLPADSAEAIGHYQQAIALDPNYFEPRLNLGTTYLEMGQLAQAKLYLEMARQLNPDHPVLRQALNDLETRLKQAH